MVSVVPIQRAHQCVESAVVGPAGRRPVLVDGAAIRSKVNAGAIGLLFQPVVAVLVLPDFEMLKMLGRFNRRIDIDAGMVAALAASVARHVAFGPSAGQGLAR